ncbi:hypothetical protein BH24PSE2_BH24PSE2_11000 [soil metagenome]
MIALGGDRKQPRLTPNLVAKSGLHLRPLVGSGLCRNLFAAELSQIEEMSSGAICIRWKAARLNATYVPREMSVRVWFPAWEMVVASVARRRWRL